MVIWSLKAVHGKIWADLISSYKPLPQSSNAELVTLYCIRSYRQQVEPNYRRSHIILAHAHSHIQAHSHTSHINTSQPSLTPPTSLSQLRITSSAERASFLNMQTSQRYRSWWSPLSLWAHVKRGMIRCDRCGRQERTCWKYAVIWSLQRKHYVYVADHMQTD